MVQVTITYNAFREFMSITADGRPLTSISRLTQFQSAPFRVWCSEILPAVYEEMNDEYSLLYIGRNCESHILGREAAMYGFCKSFQTRLAAIPDTALKRLRKLNTMCMGGLNYQRFTVSLPVYTNLPAAEIEEMFQKCLPKICFCRIVLSVHPLQEWNSANPAKYCFVLLGQPDERLSGQIAEYAREETYILSVASVSRFVGVKKMCYLEETTESDVSAVIREYLELGFFADILRRALDNIRIGEGNPQFPEFAVLDKTEPETVAVLPQSIEYGQSLPITLKTVPEGYPAKPVVYRISNDSIIQIKDNKITAVGTGETIVEVYQAGQSVCIASARIVAYRRNRITSLTLEKKELKLCVGDTCRLKFSWQPQDADNVSQVRLQSMDGTIVAVRDGVLQARRAGNTVVMAVTDNDVSARCQVTVYPKLERLDMKLERGHVAAGKMLPVSVQRVPAEAVLDNLVFRVEPSHVGHYDMGLSVIAAENAGKAKLIVTDTRNSVKAEADFTVTGAVGGGGAGKWIAILVIILVIIGFVSRFF